MTARRRKDPTSVAALGLTIGGLDTRVVQQGAMPAGRLGRSVWWGHQHLLWVSDAISLTDVAFAARHMLRDHPCSHFDDWDSTICDAQTCAFARVWAASLSDAAIAVAWDSAKSS